MKSFTGKFSFLYDRMSQKLRDLIYKKNTEFEVENYNEDTEESFVSSSYPDFDPNKIDTDPSTNLESVNNRLLGAFSLNNKPENYKDSEDNLKISFDSKSRQVSINDTNKFTPNSLHRKVKKEFRNRSSEFSKSNMNMIDSNVVQRNSNELLSYKNKSGSKDHRRMFGSGFGLSGLNEKHKEGKKC